MGALHYEFKLISIAGYYKYTNSLVFYILEEKKRNPRIVCVCVL